MHRQFWTLNLYLTAKLEDPCKEGGAEGDFSGEEEVSVIYNPRLGLVAKVIKNGVHSVFVAQEFDCCAFAIKELERFFAEISDAVGFRPFYGRLIQELWGRVDTVNPEGGNFLVLV